MGERRREDHRGVEGGWEVLLGGLEEGTSRRGRVPIRLLRLLRVSPTSHQTFPRLSSCEEPSLVSSFSLELTRLPSFSSCSGFLEDYITRQESGSSYTHSQEPLGLPEDELSAISSSLDALERRIESLRRRLPSTTRAIGSEPSSGGLEELD